MNDTKSRSGEKVTALQNIILEQANDKRAALIADAEREASNWLAAETEKLEREVALVLADAKSRAEDIHRRQILSAEREKSTEALRQQNRLLQLSTKLFLEELVKSREREDYCEILIGLAVGCARALSDDPPLKLRVAAIDAHLGPRIAAEVNMRIPGAGMKYDPESAPMLGGVWVVSGDGRRQINADWQSRAQESAGMLAERLLALL